MGPLFQSCTVRRSGRRRGADGHRRSLRARAAGRGEGAKGRPERNRPPSTRTPAHQTPRILRVERKTPPPARVSPPSRLKEGGPSRHGGVLAFVSKRHLRRRRRRRCFRRASCARIDDRLLLERGREGDERPPPLGRVGRRRRRAWTSEEEIPCTRNGHWQKRGGRLATATGTAGGASSSSAVVARADGVAVRRPRLRPGVSPAPAAPARVPVLHPVLSTASLPDATPAEPAEPAATSAFSPGALASPRAPVAAAPATPAAVERRVLDARRQRRLLRHGGASERRRRREPSRRVSVVYPCMLRGARACPPGGCFERFFFPSTGALTD